MYRPIIFVTALLTHPHLSLADTAGFRLTIGSWSASFAGEIQEGLALISLEEDLNFSDDQGIVLSLSIEHPAPLLPNVRLDYTNLKVNETSTLVRDIDFDGVNFAINEDITTDSNLSHFDGIFYYQLLDNWVSVDLGLGARLFDGSVELNSLTANAKAKLDEPIPIAYGAVRFDVPSTSISISADIKGISYQSDTALDYSAKISLVLFMGLGLEAGYRGFSMDIAEIGDFTADIDISGPYAGMLYQF